MMYLGYWGMTCLLLVPAVLWASWIDYSERRVPNWLNLAIAVFGFIFQGLYFGSAGISAGFWGMLTGFGLLIIPWLMHGMGAGDVKLMAAIGVWFGPLMTLYSFMAGAVIGGIVAVIMILSTGRLQLAYANLSIIFNKCRSGKTIFSEYGSAKSFGNSSQLLPYGVPLTAGSLLMLGMRVFGVWG